MQSLLRFDPAQQKAFITDRALQHAWNILVIGAGGSGSEMIDGLARLDYTLHALGHPGIRLHVQDADVVSESNIGRQRFVVSDVGRNKAEVLAQRYGWLLGTTITAHPFRCTQSKHFQQLRDFDLVITCVDTAKFRVQLGDHFRRRKTETLWLDLGNGQTDAQVVLGHLGKPDGPSLPHVLQLFPAIRQVSDKQQPSCSVAESIRQQMLFINRMTADAALALLVRLATQGNLVSHGAFIDLSGPSMRPLPMNPAVWAAMGTPAGTVHHRKQSAGT